MECVGSNVRPTCYVYKAFRNKRVKEILEHNTETLKRAKGVGAIANIISKEFTRFEAEEAVSPKPWYHYRMHWSGDIFSAEYAQALAIAAAKHPGTTFWIYTRSFDFVEPIVPIANINTYLSLDPVNRDEGRATLRRLLDRHIVGSDRVRLGYMSKTQDDVGVTTTPCPCDSGTVKLESACSRCLMCVKGNKDIWFKTK